MSWPMKECAIHHYLNTKQELRMLTYFFVLTVLSRLPSSYFDTPMKIVYPPESQKCLWGGEGIIQGYWEKKTPRPRFAKIRFPKTWSPVLMENVFHSEILDRWMIIIVTDSALRQIEKASGFDFYILSTPESKLKSRLGMHLKRDMLVTLAKAKMNGKMKKSWEKYSKFIIPVSHTSHIIYFYCDHSSEDFYLLILFEHIKTWYKGTPDSCATQ
ncbi:unnamed protein product [Schistosoma margrebowiei]|uniref:Large ribosomal subunit protein bL28m n=1 Tax=Schistosoma margrebowiei TaxID=48269 RepID=A0A183LR04_9TREM|nr:unnamed protein product [Schistosoma margrebowiei]